jgi:sulfatase modifying factor 1
MRTKALTLLMITLLAFAAALAAAKINPYAEPEPRQMRAAPTVYSGWPFDASEARRRQAETGKALGRPVETANSIGMKLRLIPAGEFMMGSPEEEKGRGNDESPLHRVRITKPFYLGMVEVTVAQFRRFVDATGYRTDAEKDDKGGWGYTGREERPFLQDPRYTWRDTGFPQSDDSPVVNASWNDAAAFCEWLGRKEGMAYVLPTEAEWEYACRAGTDSRFSYGDVAEEMAEAGNVSDLAANEKFALWMTISKVDREKMGTAKHRDGHVFTAPVGRFRPNAFGLYDMHGNVWEWCSDRDDPEYYRVSPTDDPIGPAEGSSRIRRGGSWLHSADFARSAARRRYPPTGRNSPNGFRVALRVDARKK